MSSKSDNKSTKAKPTPKLIDSEYSERLDLKFECAKLQRDQRRSARWISRMILERDGKTISHHSILRLEKVFDGTRQSLMRKAYTPRDPAKNQDHTQNRKDQWNYVLGHMYCRKQSLAIAHEDLVSVCEMAGWGSPMTLNAAYHKSREQGKFRSPRELEDKKRHYEKWANYARSQTILGNARWQIDEFQYAVKGRGTHETIFYGAVCVDRAFQVVRYVELSLKPINKVSFLRCWAGALNGDPDFCPIAAKPLIVQVDNAKWHEPKHSEEAYMDFRQSGTDLNIEIRWNTPECPQQDCMVENWIGNFKRDFVKGFRYYVEQVAPAQSAEDWEEHQRNLPRLVKNYGNKWNDRPQKDGMSRMDRYMKYAEAGSFKITPEEIDHGVRITEDRCVSKYGIRFGSVEYHRAGLGLRTGDKLQVRVRPGGPGPDLEAYRDGKYLGTLTRVTDDPKMHEKLNKSYIREMQQLAAEEVELRMRFNGFNRQLDLKNHPVGSRIHSMILAAMERDEPGSTAGLPGSTVVGSVAAAVVAADDESFESEVA